MQKIPSPHEFPDPRTESCPYNVMTKCPKPHSMRKNSHNSHNSQKSPVPAIPRRARFPREVRHDPIGDAPRRPVLDVNRLHKTVYTPVGFLRAILPTMIRATTTASR